MVVPSGGAGTKFIVDAQLQTFPYPTVTHRQTDRRTRSGDP